MRIPSRGKVAFAAEVAIIKSGNDSCGTWMNVKNVSDVRWIRKNEDIFSNVYNAKKEATSDYTDIYCCFRKVITDRY